MANNKKIAQASLASVIALSLLGSNIEPVLAAAADIKCYGIAAAAKNDCGTVVSSCAATIAQPKACYAWIYAPKGLCEKIADSSVGNPAKDCKGPDGKLLTEKHAK